MTRPRLHTGPKGGKGTATGRHLHAAVPGHSGDWYFTGKYPTPGGYKVVNQAYVNYFEKNEGRSY